MKRRRATPRVREFVADGLTPLAAYGRLAADQPRFLFESVTGGEQVSRYSFLGVATGPVVRVSSEGIEISQNGETEFHEGDTLAHLRRQLGSVVAEPGSIPFLGGYVGYFGYDMVRLAEPSLGAPPSDDFGLPLAVLARVDSLLVFDHARQRLLAVANEIEGEVDAASAGRRLDDLTRLLERPVSARASRLPEAPAIETLPEASLSRSDYRSGVGEIQEAIAAGEIFQAVLARRFDLGKAEDPVRLYRALRVVNPSPYMVLLELPELALVGASPEALVRKSGSRIETRPIAGTRPRGATPEQDEALALELLADRKERAEHVMLVDLGRNDLGRVAVPGSVEVRGLMEVERYSHVMHLCTSVVGELSAEHDALDLLLACFPAGTVSGAPKLRAIEILDRLEPEARGPYAGAIGYLSFAGDLDACITIRTLVSHRGRLSVTAGAGIVADSVAESEVAETESKAAALLAAVRTARRFPT